MLEWIVVDFDNSLKFAAGFYLKHYPKELFNGGAVCVNGVEIKLNCLRVEVNFVLMWLEKKWMLHDNRQGSRLSLIWIYDLYFCKLSFSKQT